MCACAVSMYLHVFGLTAHVHHGYSLPYEMAAWHKSLGAADVILASVLSSKLPDPCTSWQMWVDAVKANLANSLPLASLVGSNLP